MPSFAPTGFSIQTLPLAAIVVDEEGSLREWNDLAETLLSRTGRDEDFRTRGKSLAKETLSVAVGGPPRSAVVYFPSSDSAPIPLRAWISPVETGSSGRATFLILFAEISEAKTDDLGEPKFLRALMNNTPDNIYFKDADSRFLRINRSQASWLGLELPEEAVGKSDFDFFSEEHAWQAFGDEQEVIRTGQPIVGKEEKETWHDGRTTWVSTTKVPLENESGAIIGTLGISRNITEHKQLEEELGRTYELLETIFSSIHVKIAYLDTDFNFIRVNRAYADADGREPSFFIGRNHFDLYPHQENEAIFREVVSTRRSYFALNKPFDYPNDTERGTTYWDWSLEPVLDPQGEVKGLLLSLVDVTERTRAEKELQVSREDLRRLSARLESVIEEERRRIAHELHDELGQSLTALKMELFHIAQEQDYDSRLSFGLRSVLDMMGNCVETVRRISQDLRPAILDHLGLAAAVEWQAGEFQKRTGIICDLECHLDQVDLHGDISTALFRIVQEALTNVARHSGAARAVVSLQMSDTELSVEVRDNGRGVEPARLHNSCSLGILGMRERASRLGGSLAIVSRPEIDGTAVRVVIPMGG
ncbi:MAG: PAS domain S-box protein [Acidobacteria bacterium]|nr:MAG: PAS domain S-box protein [Acidobacteriota bacterium]